MGNYNLKSGIFRCDNCYSIYKMKILPHLPESEVNLECKCITFNKPIKTFLSELKQNKKNKINCFYCKNIDEKNSFYCYDCAHIYCQKCINKEHQKHKYISLSKLDFFCVYHQKENFCAFCKDCQINFCQKCLEGKKHLNHDIILFSKILMNKTERKFLNDKYNLAKEKMEFNSQLINTLTRKIKNKIDLDKIIKLEQENSQQNKYILELINFFTYFYDNTRFKNYSIISNFIENVNLNVNKFKFWDDKIQAENAFNKIINYFNEDFIIIKSDDIIKIDNYEKNDNMWDLSDENEIRTKKTLFGTSNFNLNLNDDSDIQNNKNDNDKKNKKASLDDNSNNYNDDYGRTRRKAIFISSKEVKKKLKEKENDTKKEEIKKSEIKNNKKEEKDIKEVNKKENKIKEEIFEKQKKQEDKIKQKNEKIQYNEKVNDNVINDKKIEKEKKNIIIEKKEKKEENKINNIYINRFSINIFRINYNSPINLMMINSFRNKKIYNIDNNKK